IIAGPSHTLEEAFDLAAKITGIPAPRFRASPALMKMFATSMGIVGTFISLPPAYTAEALRVSAGSTYLGDNSRARNELGFQARPLEEGLRQTLRYEMDLLAKS